MGADGLKRDSVPVFGRGCVKSRVTYCRSSSEPASSPVDRAASGRRNAAANRSRMSLSASSPKTLARHPESVLLLYDWQCLESTFFWAGAAAAHWDGARVHVPARGQPSSSSASVRASFRRTFLRCGIRNVAQGLEINKLLLLRMGRAATLICGLGRYRQASAPPLPHPLAPPAARTPAAAPRSAPPRPARSRRASCRGSPAAAGGRTGC